MLGLVTEKFVSDREIRKKGGENVAEQWEYKTATFTGGESLQDFLNRMGQAGWELVMMEQTDVVCGIGGDFDCVFKRKLNREDSVGGL